MNTEIIKIDIAVQEWDKQLEPAAEALRSGGLVAFPTETVYGLGANALDERAVNGIFNAKGRPSDNPLIIHIAETGALKALTAFMPENAPLIMKEFWPGPLTLLFPKSDKIPLITTAGLNTVGIRMPANPIALALIRMAGVPVAAPSANVSGKPSPTHAKHVIEDLTGKVDIIIDGGSSAVGLESTFLDILSDPPVILRPGGVTAEQLRSLLGRVDIDPAVAAGYTASTPPRSPGMKYRHYAPKAELLLVQGQIDHVVAEITGRALNYTGSGRITGILTTDETKSLYPQAVQSSCKLIPLGSKLRPESFASNLFRILREFDEKEVEVILAEFPESGGIGHAVTNRLIKAAGGNIIKV